MNRWFFPLVVIAIGTILMNAEDKQAQAAEPQLAHIVFFTMKDKADAEKLVASCHKYLSDHDGTVYYSAGIRVKDLKREVNDQHGIRE